MTDLSNESNFSVEIIQSRRLTKVIFNKILLWGTDYSLGMKHLPDGILHLNLLCSLCWESNCMQKHIFLKPFKHDFRFHKN